MSRFPQRSQAKEKILQDENTQIFHCMQTSLTKTSLTELSWLGHQIVDLLQLHQVPICETHVLPWLCQFWTQPQGKLAYKGPYQPNVRGLRLQLPEL